MILRLALRNLGRHLGRTVATGAVIFFSVGALMFAYGFAAGMGDQMILNMIRTQFAEIQIYPTSRVDNTNKPNLDHPFENVAGLPSIIERVPGVEAATPVLKFTGLLNDGVNDLPIVGMGVDMATVGRVLDFKDIVRNGAPLQAGMDGMWIGKRLSVIFERDVGDTLTFVLRTRYDMMEAVDLPILGIIETGNPRVDDYQVIVSIEKARELTDLPGGASEIFVAASQSDSLEVAAAVKKSLQDAGYDIRVETWHDAASDIIFATRADRISASIILGLIMVMGFVGLINTLLIASFERRQEIGTMMALGWRTSRVRELFVVEGLVTSLLSGLPGILVGSALTWWMSQVGISIGITDEQAAQMAMPTVGRIYPLFLPYVAVVLFAVTVVLSVVASWYPAHLAGKSDPVESLNAV